MGVKLLSNFLVAVILDWAIEFADLVLSFWKIEISFLKSFNFFSNSSLLKMFFWEINVFSLSIFYFSFFLNFEIVFSMFFFSWEIIDFPAIDSA